jgi:hypothetical protein
MEKNIRNVTIFLTLLFGAFLALVFSSCPAEAQSMTSSWVNTFTPAGDSVKQTLKWSVSGFTADSFVITQNWVATGRNVDKNGSPESAQGAKRVRAAGSTRSKVMYWTPHYGNTEVRSACVVPYKGGVPVRLGAGGSTPTVPATAISWTRKWYSIYPTKGTASDSMWARTPDSTTASIGAISYSSPKEESSQWDGTGVWAAGTYTFTIRSDDGFRVLVDGVVLEEYYRPLAPTTFTKQIVLTNATHTIHVDWFNNDGGGTFQLSWAFVPAATTPTAPTGDCLGTVASYKHWQPWKDGIFMAVKDSAIARRGTIIIVGGWLPNRISARADTLCRQAAYGSGVAQIIDLRSCMEAIDTAGATICVAVLDSAHSWGMYGVGNYPRCDETFYRAIRGKRW